MTHTVHPSVNDDALKDLAHSAYEEAMSSGLSVDTFLRYFNTIAKRASLPWTLPEAEVEAILAHAARMDPEEHAQEQANFEAWANDDICWDVGSKTKNGAAYNDQATNCAWAGYVARAMTLKVRREQVDKKTRSAAMDPKTPGEARFWADPAAATALITARIDAKKEGSVQHTQWLYQAAINCAHEIDGGKIVLHFNEKQIGNNAFDQLANRLSTYALARYQVVDGGTLSKAAIGCPHEITEKTVILHFDASREGHNALNQLGKRLSDSASENFLISEKA